MGMPSPALHSWLSETLEEGRELRDAMGQFLSYTDSCPLPRHVVAQLPGIRRHFIAGACLAQTLLESGGQLPKARKLCPKGHALYDIEVWEGTCDACGVHVPDGAYVMDCRLCDWCLCRACHPGLEAASIVHSLLEENDDTSLRELLAERASAAETLLLATRSS